MRTLSKLIVPLLLVSFIGCTSLYNSVVTITQVVDSAMKDWAALSVAGKSTPQIDVSVRTGYAKYQAACAVAQTALEAYKASGDSSQYVAALQAAKAAASALIDLIVPLVTPTEASTLQTNLSKASKI